MFYGNQETLQPQTTSTFYCLIKSLFSSSVVVLH